MSESKNYTDFVQSIPPSGALREQLAKNHRERDLIKRLIRIAEQRERLDLNRNEREGATCQR
jgi:hypothetical protein